MSNKKQWGVKESQFLAAFTRFITRLVLRRELTARWVKRSDGGNIDGLNQGVEAQTR